MNAEEMWALYKEKNNILKDDYVAWSFGGQTDLLAKLVAMGEKTATAAAYDLYEIENEPLSVVGGYNVILNSQDEAVCITKTIKVYIVPFNRVSELHAFKEGEGDKSLTYWRKVHKKFFKECLSGIKRVFTEEMEVVCEEFEVVFK